MSKTTHQPDTETKNTVTIPVAPPRDPEAYRVTSHFRNRLRERVESHQRDTLPGELIRNGYVHRVPATAADVPNHEWGATVAFTTAAPTGRPWTLVAALRPTAFSNPDEHHRAITIYQGTAPDTTAATARGDCGE